jgi:hypothetical protein
MVSQQLIDGGAISLGITGGRYNVRRHPERVKTGTIGIRVGHVEPDFGIVRETVDVINSGRCARKNHHVGHTDSLRNDT